MCLFWYVYKYNNKIFIKRQYPLIEFKGAVQEKQLKQKTLIKMRLKNSGILKMLNINSIKDIVKKL